MSVKHRLLVVTSAIVLTIGGSAFTSPASATGNPGQLDIGDFTSQCRTQYGSAGWQAHLYEDTAYGWKCFYNNNPFAWLFNERKPLNINQYCQRL